MTITTTPPSANDTTHPGRRLSASGIIVGAIEKSAALVLLFALVFYFSIAVPDLFPTGANVRTLLLSQAITGVIAIATMIPLMTGRFDLSVGSVIPLSSVVTAKLMSEQGTDPVIAVAAGLLVG